MQELSNSGEATAIILIKAVPHVSQKHGETVCCAGIDIHGNWLRLYPVSFKHLEDNQKFGRWDKITFKWRKPRDDKRPESRRVIQDTIEIISKVKESERARILKNSIYTSLNKATIEGKTLVLLKPKNPMFIVEKKTEQEITEEERTFAKARSQGDLFAKQVTPHQVCRYRFKYRYDSDDGRREGTCQDWETDATFFRWTQKYGEEQALSYMKQKFGDEYPKKGFMFSMGTHSLYPDRWLINGVVRISEPEQQELF